MQHVLFSTRLTDGRVICVSPISADTFEANKAHSLGDDTGYFIYEYDAHRQSIGLEILAKAISFDAAVRLVDIFVGAALVPPESIRKKEGPLRQTSGGGT